MIPTTRSSSCPLSLYLLSLGKPHTHLLGWVRCHRSRRRALWAGGRSEGPSRACPPPGADSSTSRCLWPSWRGGSLCSGLLPGSRGQDGERGANIRRPFCICTVSETGTISLQYSNTHGNRWIKQNGTPTLNVSCADSNTNTIAFNVYIPSALRSPLSYDDHNDDLINTTIHHVTTQGCTMELCNYAPWKCTTMHHGNTEGC